VSSQKSLKITNSQKKKVQQALTLISQVFGKNKDLKLSEMKEMLKQAQIEKEVQVSSDFSLPDLGKKYSYYAFSDGACRGNPGPGAWGSLVQDKTGLVIYEGSSVELGTTNNRMELQGALEALKFLKKEFSSAQSIALISDSKYVVEGLKSWMSGWKKRGWKKADGKAPENIELWQELDQVVSQLREVQYFWVKGHSGHPQNEKCDQLANEALDDAGF